MQDIFIHEKGKEALRTFNIRLGHSKNKEKIPDYERVAKAEKEKLDSLVPKIKKTLQVDVT